MDGKAKMGDGFRLVITATFDTRFWECPNDYTSCRNDLCISRSLICDGVNHCIDNSDELSCNQPGSGGGSSGSIFASELSLSNALGLLVVLVLIIFACVIIFISAVYCRARESPYAQYQHHLQPINALHPAIGVLPDHHIPHQQPTIVLCRNVYDNPWRIDAQQQM